MQKTSMFCLLFISHSCFARASKAESSPNLINPSFIRLWNLGTTQPLLMIYLLLRDLT